MTENGSVLSMVDAIRTMANGIHLNIETTLRTHMAYARSSFTIDQTPILPASVSRDGSCIHYTRENSS